MTSRRRPASSGWCTSRRSSTSPSSRTTSRSTAARSRPRARTRATAPPSVTTAAQEQAPIIVTKMKSSGVTTMIMLSDVAMNKAMMAQATKQEWFPEWYVTGAVFQDIAIFARSYDQQQSAHVFGVSNLAPYVQPDPTPPPPAVALSVQILPLTWYWGQTVGTQVTSVVPAIWRGSCAASIRPGPSSRRRRSSRASSRSRGLAARRRTTRPALPPASPAAPHRSGGSGRRRRRRCSTPPRSRCPGRRGSPRC